MIDHTAIAAGESLRAEIAVLMAAYEAEHGPVETKPIVARLEQKRTAYNRGASPSSKVVPTIAPSPALPLRKRGTPQAKQAAILREVWPQ